MAAHAPCANSFGTRGDGNLTLTAVVETLATLGKAQLPQQLARWLDRLDENGRWALIKLVTGGLRIGVSARLAKTAVAALGNADAQEIELLWPGLAPPYTELFAWLEGRGKSRRAAIRHRSGRRCWRTHSTKPTLPPRSVGFLGGVEMGRHSRAGRRCCRRR